MVMVVDKKGPCGPTGPKGAIGPTRAVPPPPPTGPVGPGGIKCGPGRTGPTGPRAPFKSSRDLENLRFEFNLMKDAVRLNPNRYSCFGTHEWKCQDCEHTILCSEVTSEGVELHGAVVILGEL